MTSLSSASFQIDGNIYYKTSRYGSPFRLTSGTAYPSFSAWQKASGQDKNSFFTDPQLVGGLATPSDLHLKSGSSAIGKAVNTPSYVTDDFEGSLRNAKPDIGAFEFDPLFRSFGKGCAGSGGFVPSVGIVGIPKIGSTLELTVRNTLAGPSVHALLIIGASNQRWGTIPLPLSFGSGCDLLVSADLLYKIPVVGLAGPGKGTASIKITVPNDPKLKGAKAFFQWGVVDPAAAGIGVAFSNAAALTLTL